MTNDIQNEITHQKHFKQFSQIFLCRIYKKRSRFIHFLYTYNKRFSYKYVRLGNVYSCKMYTFCEWRNYIPYVLL